MDAGLHNQNLSRAYVNKTFYTAADLQHIKDGMTNYFISKSIDPDTISQTISDDFQNMAEDICNSKLLSDKAVVIKASYLRNLFFYEKYPKFKQLSQEAQNNTGIARNPRLMRAISRFFELYFNTEPSNGNGNANCDNVKWIKMREWKPHLHKHNPQGEDHLNVLLNGGLLKQLRCKVIAKSKYYRFGFKLLDAKTDLVGDGLIKARNNDVLIHTGQSSQTDFSRTDLFVSLYVGLEKIIPRDEFTNIYPSKEGYDCVLYIDSEMTLHFFINKVSVLQHTISKKVLGRVFMFAWADHDEFDISVKDIFIEIQ